MTDRHGIYLSYHHSDAEFALCLAADLKNLGVQLWMDRLEVGPGDRWQDALRRALDGCAATLAVFSPEYLAAGYTRRELTRAQQVGHPIFPLVVRPIPESGLPVRIERPPLDFSAWTQEDAYLEQVEALINTLEDEAADQISPLPELETRYLTALLARLELDRGVVEHLGRASEDDEIRPPPRAHTLWVAGGTFQARSGHAGTLDPLRAQVARYKGIREVAASHRRFVLVGPPSAGKTAILHHLVAQAVHARRTAPDDTAPLPLFLKLAEWQDDDRLADFLRAHWPFDSDPIPLLAEGKVALYLDGLSEINVSAAKKVGQLREWLRDKDAPQALVITCRSEDYQADLVLELPCIQVAPWDEAYVLKYLESYLAEDQTKKTLETLLSGKGSASGNVHGLHRFMRQPFLLPLLILDDDGTPAETAAQSVAGLLKRLVAELWEQQQVSATISFAELERGLCALAFALINDDMPVFVPVEYAREHAREALGSGDLLAAENSRVFLQTCDGYVRFIHQPVQNYFAALQLLKAGALTRLAPPQFDSSGQRMARAWDAVVVILSGLAPDPDLTVRQIAEVDPFLALDCLTSGIVTKDSTRALAVLRLERAMCSGDHDGRVTAARLLAALDYEKAIKVLLETMRNGTWEARWAATGALYDLKPSLMPELTEAFRELDQEVRDATALGLRRLRAAALPTLIQLIRDEHWFMRRSAAWALGEVGDKAAVPALIEALHDRESLVIPDAAIALGWLRDPMAIPWLQKLLQQGNWRAREACATALGWFGAPAVDAMLAEVRTGSNEVRRLVVEALNHMRDSAVLNKLLEATHDNNPEVRSAAVEALRNVEGDVFMNRLIELLADTAKAQWERLRICDIAASILAASGKPNALRAVKRWREERSGAAGGKSAAIVKDRLGKITGPGAASPSADSPRRSDWRSRRDALLALKGVESRAALWQLAEGLRDKDADVRATAVEVLETCSSETALRALIKALGDDDYLVYSAAVDAVANLGRRAVPYLSRALHDKKANVRGAALKALNKIADPSVVPDLVRCLSDQERPWRDDQRICDLAARALEAIGTSEALHVVQQWRVADAQQHHRLERLQTPAVEATRADRPQASGPTDRRHILLGLLANLHRQDWPARQEAAKALRDYTRLLRGTRDPVVLRQLLEALQDPDWGVRWAVVEALAWLGDADAVPSLIEHLRDPNANVRIAVIRSLLEIKDPQAIPGITQALSDSSKLVREAAAEALGELQAPAAVPALTGALNDSEEFVRLAAIEAMGKLKDNVPVQVLAEAMHDRDNRIRWAAAAALGQVANAAAIPALIGGLQDTGGPYWEEKRICDLAAFALERIGTPEARSALEQWRSQGAALP